MIIERLFADAARAVACRDRQGRRDQSRSARSRERRRCGRRPRGVPGLLPHRRLLHADAGPFQRARADADQAVRGDRRDRRAARPSVGPDRTRTSSRNPAVLLALIVSETLIGALIGLMARLYVLALQFIGSAIAMLIGYGGAGGAGHRRAGPAGSARLADLLLGAAAAVRVRLPSRGHQGAGHVLRPRAGQRLVQSADARWSTSPTRSRNPSW